jgi:hypothetical protein
VHIIDRAVCGEKGAEARRLLDHAAVLDGGIDADRSDPDDENAHRSGAAGAWRNRFIRAPHYGEHAVARGILSSTFETSMTWERFRDFHQKITTITRDTIKRVTGRDGTVTCRFTHVYPDGPAPYFTFHALGEPGKLDAQWRAIKSAALDAVIANGGTVTHHHAVGRDHRPWYDRQRPPLFAEALRAAKKALDTGFVCDTISTDIYVLNVNGPVYDMPTTMSKMLYLGMSVDDILVRVTAAPAKIINRLEGMGQIKVGGPADLALLELEEGQFGLIDSQRNTVTANKRFISRATIVKGRRMRVV